MINCRNCINWVDESLEQVEADKTDRPHVFMGCRIFGYIKDHAALESCSHYQESENLFTVCHSCRLPVPKVCVSLGECVNCTDTDLFCVDHCLGMESRKYCTHFIRLYSEGVHLIDRGRVFDLFPAVGLPTKKKETSPSEETEIPVAEAAVDHTTGS
jgi:hypothetical protein